VIAGATAYLTKPFTKDSLLKTVRDHVPQHVAG
jgi:DNA-binding response OmpR family regulator